MSQISVLQAERLRAVLAIKREKLHKLHRSKAEAVDRVAEVPGLPRGQPGRPKHLEPQHGREDHPAADQVAEYHSQGEAQGVLPGHTDLLLAPPAVLEEE